MLPLDSPTISWAWVSLEIREEYKKAKTYSGKSGMSWLVHPSSLSVSTFRYPSDALLPTVVGFPLKYPRPPFTCEYLDENVKTRAVNRGWYFRDRAPALKSSHRAPGRFSRAHRILGEFSNSPGRILPWESRHLWERFENCKWVAIWVRIFFEIIFNNIIVF